MALCRIYLLTYRRNHLLSRALNSLINQTVTDWICELHNDDPTDPFPGQLGETYADPRIVIVNHAKNLGPTRTFNLVFKETAEPFISLLEDDNWWEPHFLASMINGMKQFPEIQIAWANMRFWQEETDGNWTDTGRNIWSSNEDSPQLFDWGQPQQIMGALHSNGAMLIRSSVASRLIIPEETPFATVEPVRERAFSFPILFIPQVCANFAITQASSRSRNRTTWSQIQILLIASYFKHISTTEEIIREVWSDARSKPAKSTASLFFAALICLECRYLLDNATFADWLFFIAVCLKRPNEAWANLRSIRAYPTVWAFLDQQTADRVSEKQLKTNANRQTVLTNLAGS